MGNTQARPGSVDGALDEARTDRIEEDVAEDREEMAVLLNRKTFEAALPHMAVAPVVPLIATDMAGQPPRHEGTEAISGRGRHNKMKRASC